MATPRGRVSASHGVVRALGRLILLVTLGFGAGLLIGVVSEEPELLAGHLRGDSEGVALSDSVVDSKPLAGREAEESRTAVLDRTSLADEVPSPPEPRVVAPPPGASQAAAPLPAVAAPAPGPERPAREGEEAWSIQVGAFSDEAAAEGLAESLRAKGYPVELLPSDGGSGRWRVRVQPVRGETRAREMADRLKRSERLPTWVVPMEGRSKS